MRKTLNQTRGTAGDEGTDAERNRESGNDGREYERKVNDLFTVVHRCFVCVCVSLH